MTSGLIDRTDISGVSFEDTEQTSLARVGDARLRERILDFIAFGCTNPEAGLPAMWWRWAAWQPLLFTPGAGEHDSNIGYDVL